ncbi:MAG TPA: hypothetical protein VKY22_00960 [Bradyrhizobium sp.]|nr:hypothetical protein [Bradyrhizobium sp.]
MTTEAAISASVMSGKPMSIGRLPLGGLLAVLAIWFLGMAVMATLVQPDAVIGFGPPAKMIPAVVSSDGDLLDAGRFTVAATTGHSTVRSLYAAGAWFVWPIIARGCGRS